MIRLTRRQTLVGMLGGALAATAGLSACGRGGSGGSATGSIRMGWWGNELRAAQTQEAIDLFMELNEGVSIDPMPADFAAYWDRLATETAAGDAPDVIQMADGFIAEYASRDTLLDLSDLVDVSKFGPGMAETGMIDGKLVGINAGVNVPVFMCNLGVLERAGVDRPDDTTWTWDQFRDLSAQISSDTEAGVHGTASPFQEGVLRAWLRQHGEELFTTEGVLGASVESMRGYFEMAADYMASGAMPGAAQIVEDASKPLEEAPVAIGTTAFSLFWSNQLSALSRVSGDEIVMLRMPTTTGVPEDLKAWYHPSQLWSASAKTDNPELVGKLIDWWVNSFECAEINLDERGAPANTEVVEHLDPLLSDAGKQVAQFLADLEPVLGDPQPIPPAGAHRVFDEVMVNLQNELFFDRIDPAEAAERFVTESKSALGE